MMIHQDPQTVMEEILPSKPELFMKSHLSSPKEEACVGDDCSIYTEAESSSEVFSLQNSFSEHSVLVDTESSEPRVYGSGEEQVGSSRRRVLFSEELNVYYENKMYSKEDCTEFWFDQEEYTQFKIFSSFIANSVGETARRGSIKNMAQSFIELTAKSYLTCCSSKNSPYKNDNHNDENMEELNHGMVFTRGEQKVMNQIYADTGGAVLVGLEKNIVRSLARDAQDRRKDMMRAVEELQKRHQERELGLLVGGSCSIEDSNSLALAIRTVCERFSRPSVLFARHMALLHRDLLD